MLLVMVAWTFPSHGRTESENIFNKTLPHESMNNVTVSSSKVVSYDYLLLAMQWPRTYCNLLISRGDGRCFLPVPDRFTVHGLWPQKFGGPINCSDTGRYGRYPGYDWRQVLLVCQIQRIIYIYIYIYICTYIKTDMKFEFLKI